MKLLSQITIISTVLIGLSSCQEKSMGYDLPFSTKTLYLSEKLNEISGLTYLTDSSIACIQDEKAIIYFLNTNSGKILRKFDFGKNNDFEGITSNRETFYVLRSDGSIFRVKEDNKLKRYDFHHHKHFDFEGICYDSTKDRLLVACKSHGEKDQEDYFFIYSFSLKDKVYLKEPAFKIKKKNVHQNFMPSGIAIHPNGNIYIISSHSKTLLIISDKGKILNTGQLNSFVFRQPEGITFDPYGNMFISNEAAKTVPTLLKFTSEHETN